MIKVNFNLKQPTECFKLNKNKLHNLVKKKKKNFFELNGAYVFLKMIIKIF